MPTAMAFAATVPPVANDERLLGAAIGASMERCLIIVRCRFRRRLPLSGVFYAYT
jgi:hypothetical protein